MLNDTADLVSVIASMPILMKMCATVIQLLPSARPATIAENLQLNFHPTFLLMLFTIHFRTKSISIFIIKILLLLLFTPDISELFYWISIHSHNVHIIFYWTSNLNLAIIACSCYTCFAICNVLYTDWTAFHWQIHSMCVQIHCTECEYIIAAFNSI